MFLCISRFIYNFRCVFFPSNFMSDSVPFSDYNPKKLASLVINVFIWWPRTESFAIGDKIANLNQSKVGKQNVKYKVLWENMVCVWAITLRLFAHEGVNMLTCEIDFFSRYQQYKKSPPPLPSIYNCQIKRNTVLYFLSRNRKVDFPNYKSLELVI